MVLSSWIPARASHYTRQTLKVGPDDFLAAGAKKGLIDRYKERGDTLEWCDSFGPSFVDFIEAKYTKATSIARNDGEGTYPVTKRFESEVIHHFIAYS